MAGWIRKYFSIETTSHPVSGLFNSGSTYPPVKAGLAKFAKQEKLFTS